MFNILGRKLKVPFLQGETATVVESTAPDVPPQAETTPEPVDVIDPAHPHLDLIVVPRSAMDALESDPDKIVQSVINYTNFLLSRGHYKRNEIPHEAIEAYHCDYYLAQVLNGGHAQFVGNSGKNRVHTVADTLKALDAMEADDYLDLADRMADWVKDNADLADSQTGFEGGIADALSDLDNPFFELNEATPLRPMLAQWIAGLDIVQVVDDQDMPRVLEGIARLNGLREQRNRTARIVGIEDKIANTLNLGIGLAASNAPTVEAVIAIGNGSYQDVGEFKKLLFVVQTSGGPRWAEMGPEGATLYERVVHDNSHLPNNPMEASLDDIKSWKAPEVGEVISRASMSQIEGVKNACAELNVGATLDLLLSKYGAIKSLDAISVRSAGPDTSGAMGATLLLVANQGTLALSAVITGSTSRLLAEPSHEEVATVAAEEAATYREDNLPDAA